MSPDPTDYPRPYSWRDAALDAREPAEGLRLGEMRLSLCFGRFTVDALWVVDWGGREDRREDRTQTVAIVQARELSPTPSYGAAWRAGGVEAYLVFVSCPVHASRSLLSPTFHLSTLSPRPYSTLQTTQEAGPLVCLHPETLKGWGPPRPTVLNSTSL